MSFIVLIRGGGDLASGVALRLHRSGLRVAISELPEPLAVRRLVSFAEAVYTGEWKVEEVTARKITDLTDTFKILRAFSQKQIPVLIDPDGEGLRTLRPTVLIDARMTKRPPEIGIRAASLVIGLGPGFTAGENCHAVIETKRGHRLGRVIWAGPAEPDSGEPDSVMEHSNDRILRAPVEGLVEARCEVGNLIKAGQVVAEVGGVPVLAAFPGVLRGLIHPGIHVPAGLKIGDIDPRSDTSYARLVSDKSLAVGGGVLEAILTRQDLRSQLWT